ncbi:MAG TPA: glycoside hydrolase family 16 protein [Candidatus Acidoferrales bacterium]|nr:glycoside hydrolase family 16 protein [Candidatus Acidoferrales bacterium]
MESAHSPRSFVSARGNRRRLRALALVCLLFPAACAAQSWTLAWSDEFDVAAGSPINSSNWQYDTGILKVNNEVEYYCAPASSTPPCVSAAPNAYIDGNGHLVIQAIRINSSVTPYSGSWTSARLNTGRNLRNFQFGRLESSISLPVGAGLWPAFWALGNNIGGIGWPASGEMDFMENVPASGGLGPNAFRSTIHGGNSSSSCYCGGNGLGQSYTFPIKDHSRPTVAGFHSYGAIWSTNMVQFYVDDPRNVFLVRTVNDLPAGFSWDFNRPFFLLLNLAVGGTGSWPGPADGNTPNPAVMTVDYVRWYKPSAVAGPTMSAAPISVKSGGAGSATLSVNSTSGTGRVYLSCTTTAPKATCSINSGDVLNTYTVDFSKTGHGSATVKLTTIANPPGLPKGGRRNATRPGNYSVTVSSYTVSNTSGNPDSVLSIPLTVN